MQVKRVRQVHAQVYLSFEGAFLNLEDWLYIENILLFWSTKLSKLIQGLMEIVSIILSILFFYKFPILPHHAFIFILLKGEFEIITDSLKIYHLDEVYCPIFSNFSLCFLIMEG